MNRSQIADLYFAEARAKLIDLAAIIDRIDRSEGSDDFRVRSLRAALLELGRGVPDRTKRVLMLLSDRSTDPIPHATPGPATGAWRGYEGGEV